MKSILVFTLLAFQLFYCFNANSQSLAEEKMRADRKAKVQEQIAKDERAEWAELQAAIKANAFIIKCGNSRLAEAYAFYKGFYYRGGAAEYWPDVTFDKHSKLKLSKDVISFTWLFSSSEYHINSQTMYTKAPGATSVGEMQCDSLSNNQSNIK
jgi:hypothetical protein